MQQRCSLKHERASAGLAAIEFGKSPIHEFRIRVQLSRQLIEPAAKQCQHGRHVVPGHATGIEKDVDAGAQLFGGARVSSDEVIESRAWMRRARVRRGQFGFAP